MTSLESSVTQLESGRSVSNVICVDALHSAETIGLPPKHKAVHLASSGPLDFSVICKVDNILNIYCDVNTQRFVIYGFPKTRMQEPEWAAKKI